MTHRTHLPLVVATCALLAVPVSAQVHDPADPMDASSLGHIEQISPREWLLNAEVSENSMAKARAKAISDAASRVATELSIPGSSGQADYLEKLLIVDESYDSGIYRALLRIISRQEDPDFATAMARQTDFQSSSVPDAQRPAWVLLVPASVKEDGSWDIAKRQSTWASRWRIPFRDGVTQFVPATFDADDRAVSQSAQSFDEMSEHLKERYGAENILYAAKTPGGEIMLSHWSDSAGWMGTLSAGTDIDAGNATTLRASVLDSFWSTFPKFSEPSARVLNTPASHDRAYETSRERQNDLMRYRLVGQPRPDGDVLRGFLQVIRNERTTLQDTRKLLSSVDRLQIVSLEDHGSSFFVEYRYEAGSADSLKTALSEQGFSPDLF